MKTVLIVGGAAIGALLLWRYASASPGASSALNPLPNIPGGDTMTAGGQSTTTTGRPRPLGGLQSVFQMVPAPWRPGALPPSTYTADRTPQLTAGPSSAWRATPTTTNAATQSAPSAPQATPGAVQILSSRPGMVLR